MFYFIGILGGTVVQLKFFILKFKPSVNAGELLFSHKISSHTVFLGLFLAVNRPIKFHFSRFYILW